MNRNNAGSIGKGSVGSLSEIFGKAAHARAVLSGGREYPDIKGLVRFYMTNRGALVVAEIKGLPMAMTKCSRGVFGFHIHEGSSCTGSASDQFADTKMHYNPEGCPHPYHAGDMPPLFSADGYAFLAFMSNSFTLGEIIGKTVVVHSMPDDFTTQPSGNSGVKIACGVIDKVRWRFLIMKLPRRRVGVNYCLHCAVSSAW